MKNRKGLLLILLAVMMLGLVGCGTQVPSGHRGVFYSKFGDGTEMGKIYPEGFTWHLPWNSVYVYQIQMQERKEDLTVLSSDGATIRMEVSVLYRPKESKLDSLQIDIGRNYYDVAVAPNIRGIARAVAGTYKPEEIYSTKRDEVSKAIQDRLISAMDAKHIVIENVLVRDVVIPAKITEAINFKLSADQEAQKMQFTIEKERLEADRKRIEAKGIADFQTIVAAGITPSYLKWKGIEATTALAQSPNSKVIVVGNSSQSMPIILSADK
ncbi:MAG: prohibitin family protein [candidate division Zixibacteria bacterium]|nr:prohibitin family protein [candidate division Zixibacteria bacterium]